MKTLKQIREEYNSQFLDLVENLPEEVMLEAAKKTSLMSTTPSFKQMPSLLVFRRITYRKYPNDQVVALYYSTLVDKYLSIPFGPGGNLNLSEGVMHDEMNEDLRKWFKEKWVRYDTKGNIKGPCAREEGEGKPKCRPLASARSMSKEDRAKSARRKRREDPVADRPGKGGKPVMVKTNEETLLEKNVPTNPALWARAKAQARSKFDVYPSAYANGWASKWYKSKGGGWKSSANESVDEACWATHKQVGWKKKGKRMVPDCVLKEADAKTNAEFYSKVSKAGEAAGMPSNYAKQMASISALESGWGTSRMAKQGNNYFGQTTRSKAGSMIGADKQAHKSYASSEDAVSQHIQKWGQHYRDDPKETYANLVKAGYNTVNPKWQSTIMSIHNKMNTDKTQVASTPKTPEAPKPTQVTSAPEAPKMQNPDQNITKVASTPTPTQTSQLDTKEKQKIAESEAWTRKAGQDPKGGLNRKGIRSYRAKHPGSTLSMAVTRKPSTLDPKGKAAKRRKSFCARMGGMKKRLTSAKTARDPDSRINKALRKWNCEESFNMRLYELRQQKMNEGIVDAVTGAVGGYMTGGLGGALAGGAKGLFKGSKKKQPKQGNQSTTYSTEFGRTPDAKGKKVNLIPTSQGSDPASQSRASSLENKYREKSMQASQQNENKMSDIRKMVREGIETKDLTINGRSVTLNTSMAKRILEVYDSVNTKNKKLVEGMLNEDMESFKKLLNFSIKA